MKKTIFNKILLSKTVILVTLLSLSFCHWTINLYGILLGLFIIIIANKKQEKKKKYLFLLLGTLLAGAGLVAGIFIGLEETSFTFLVTFAVALYLTIFGEYEEGKVRRDAALILTVLTIEVIVECSQEHYLKIFEMLGFYGIYGFDISRILFVVNIVYMGSVLLILRPFFSKRTSYLIVADLIFILSIINMFVLEYTGLPFVWSDIKLFSTAFSVLGEYHMNKKFMIRLALTLAAMILFNLIGFSVFDHEKQKFSFKNLLFYLVPSLMMIVVLTPTLSNSDLEAVLKFDGNIKNGFFLNFALSAKPNLSKPKGYQKDKALIFDQKAEYLIEPEQKPNIIIIMNEAFSDMNVNTELKTNIEVLPYTKQFLSEYPSGHLVSSVLGRNTCTSEFEFLSGIPSLLSCQGADIYSAYINDSIPTISKTMKDLGYTVKGLHPYFKSGYFRSKAWPLLGLEDSLFIEELAGKDIEFLREFASDAFTYEQIKQMMEECEEPLFLMCVTMQNHGGYTDKAEGLKEYIHCDGYDDPELDNYLSLVHETDRQTKLLLDELSESSEPTVVLFFGDHQPLLTDFFIKLYGEDESNEEVIYKKHQVPYFLWNNYGAEFSVPEEISYNYLTSMLLKNLNIYDPWFDYIYSFMDEYPVLSNNLVKNKNGIMNMEDFSAILKDQNQAIKQYEYSIYRYLNDHD